MLVGCSTTELLVTGGDCSVDTPPIRAPDGRPVRVLAVVLTFNAPEALSRCARALLRELGEDDAVLVVDNDSNVPASEILGTGWPVHHLRLPDNVGPAGGYARGLERFLSSGARFVWLIDDDMVLPEGSLDALLRRLEREPSMNGVWPMVRRPNGAIVAWPCWGGALFRREAISTLGLPRADFFWWAEDTEYLQVRLRQHGGRSVFDPDVIIDHGEVRRSTSKPAWKFYYEVRNVIFLRWYLQTLGSGWSRPRMIRRMVGAIAKQTARAMFREDDKLSKIEAIARGILDGFAGNLGIRDDYRPGGARDRARTVDVHSASR